MVPPRLDEQFFATQLSSGLFVATRQPVRTVSQLPSDLPSELRPPEPALFVLGTVAPAQQNAVLAAPTLLDLGYPATSLDEVFGLLAAVPFEPAMLMASALAADVYHHPRDVSRQLGLAREVFPPEVVQRIERFVAEEPSATVVFDPRHLLALQRVLVMHAAPDPEPARGLTAAEVQSVGVALLALASVLPIPDPPAPRDDAPPDWRAWTSFFAQSAAWYHEPHILEAVARTYTAFAEIASAPELSGHPARSEVDERLRSVYGLDLAEQLGGGLACAAISRAVDPDIDLRARPHIEPGFLSKGLLATKEQEVIALVSASREQLHAELLAAGDTAHHIGWDHSVLERYPFVRLPDGRMRLTSPRALVAWMTRGLHYRLLDAAGTGLAAGPARKARGRFLTFAGALGEGYVGRLASASLRHAVAAGAVRVHGEVEFHVGKDRRDSPDLAIESGTDLILVEVYSGRMSLAARTGADPSALEAFVDRSTAGKLLELADRIRDVLAGDLRYEGMELRNVRRIFPVLVLAGDTIAQTPPVWGHLRDTAPLAFIDDRRVQPPAICDLDDLEPLLALAEEGHHLPDLLAAFLESDDAEFSPRNWTARVYGLDRRPDYVTDQYLTASERVRRRMFAGS